MDLQTKLVADIKYLQQQKRKIDKELAEAWNSLSQGCVHRTNVKFKMGETIGDTSACAHPDRGEELADEKEDSGMNQRHYFCAPRFCPLLKVTIE